MFGYFGITNNGVNLAINLLGLFLAFVWLALVYWTRVDAKRRIKRPGARRLRDRALAVPLRRHDHLPDPAPPEYLEDIRERELEMAAAEARLAQVSYLACQQCGNEVEKDYLICPACHSRLREPCESCRRPLETHWTVCPYCEAPVVGALHQRRRREAYAAEMPPGA